MKHLKIRICSPFAVFSSSSTLPGKWSSGRVTFFLGQEVDCCVGPCFQSWVPGARWPVWPESSLPLFASVLSASPPRLAGISSLMTLSLPSSSPGFLGHLPGWSDSSFLSFLVACCLHDNYSTHFSLLRFYCSHHEQIRENHSLKEYQGFTTHAPESLSSENNQCQIAGIRGSLARSQWGTFAPLWAFGHIWRRFQDDLVATTGCRRGCCRYWVGGCLGCPMGRCIGYPLPRTVLL